MLEVKKPTTATAMMAISAIFTHLAICARSYLSATCPAVAEKRKKGKMKRPPASATMICGSTGDWSERRKATSIKSAFLKRLSLNAPRNCVRNSGKNRRDFRMDMHYPLFKPRFARYFYFSQ